MRASIAAISPLGYRTRMIKIYGSPGSSAGRCLWLLEEIGVPYERVEVNLRDHAAKARFVQEVFAGGRVPYLIDGDVRLFESMAINSYLASKYKPELLPTDIVERAQVEQWSYWAISNLQTDALKVMMHTMFLPEAQRDAKILEASRNACCGYLDHLESALQGEWLVGARFTLADLNCGSVVNLALRAGVDAGRRVTGWMEGLRARPAYRKALGG